MEINKEKQIEKCIETLKLGGKSKCTISNYVSAIRRFLDFVGNVDLSSFTEEDIIDYFKDCYLNKNCSAFTYNLNLCAIKFFFLVNYKIEFNNKLLPSSKVTKRIPTAISHEDFDYIFSNEKNIKHKCWLLLAYCSGLRVNEIATIKIKDINANENKIKILGKRNKERYTVLTNFTIKYLRNFYAYKYYKNKFLKSMYSKGTKSGYLFEGNDNGHVNPKTIINYFSDLKKKHNLDENLTLHSLRHAFATNFIKKGGDTFDLKSMMGHASLNTTSIYIHTAKNFSNLKGVEYEKF